MTTRRAKFMTHRCYKSRFADPYLRSLHAGARNPYDVVGQWPELLEGMADIRKVLIEQVMGNPDLQDLADACGDAPARGPPKPSSVKKVRHAIGKILGLSGKQTDLNHPASPWKWRLVKEVQTRTRDPDVAVAGWLERGAPFGIAEPIEPGGLLPVITETASLTADDLYDQTLFDDNHRSFKERIDGGQPALDELQSLVDAGFARVCKDMDEAEQYLGKRPLVSPLGNVTKARPDGTLKHRLIQDFRASSVNCASTVSERQVLPRFADHAFDLATLSAFGSSVGVFVLDFKHAFMTIPSVRRRCHLMRQWYLAGSLGRGSLWTRTRPTPGPSYCGEYWGLAGMPTPWFTHEWPQ